MRTGITIPKALRKRRLVVGEKTSRGAEKSRGRANWQDQLFKDEAERFVGRSEPHFTNPTNMDAPQSEGSVFVSHSWRVGKPDLARTGEAAKVIVINLGN